MRITVKRTSYLIAVWGSLLPILIHGWSPLALHAGGFFLRRPSSGRRSSRQASSTVDVETTGTTDAPENDSFKRQTSQLRRYTEQALNGRPAAVLQAAEVVVELHNAGNTASTLAYNSLLKAWKKYAVVVDAKHWEKAMQESEALLLAIRARKVADVCSYTTVMSTLALGRSQDSAIRATSILDEIRGDGLAPNARTCNAVLLAWTNCGNLVRAEELLSEWECEPSTQLTAASYTTVMIGYAKLQKGVSVDRFDSIIRIWERLCERYENDCRDGGSSEAVRPNLYALTMLVNACQQQRTAVAMDLAAQALYRFHKYQQNVALAEAAAGSSASLDDENIYQLNTQVVTAILDGWQKSGARDAGVQAEELLRWMVDEYKATGDADLRPNAYSFATAIGAWARSRTFGKAVRAADLLQWMQELHRQDVLNEPPNVYCYTGVINSCAYSEREDRESKRALDIAVQTYQQLLQADTDEPSHVTFAAFLTALRNLAPPSPKRDAAIQKVFGEAVSRGQVCPLVLKRLQSAMPREEVQTILASVGEVALAQKNPISVHQIPAYWRRNVNSKVNQ